MLDFISIIDAEKPQRGSVQYSMYIFMYLSRNGKLLEVFEGVSTILQIS